MEYRKDMFQNLTTTSQSHTLRKSETTNLNATLHPNVPCVDIGMLRHGFMRFWTVRFQRMSVSHYIRIRLKTSWYFVIWCGILWKHEDKIGTDSIEWKGTLTVWGCKMTIFYKIYNRMFESSRSTAICVQWDKGVFKAKDRIFTELSTYDDLRAFGVMLSYLKWVSRGNLVGNNDGDAFYDKNRSQTVGQK